MKAGLLIFTSGPAEALELARDFDAHALPRNFADECEIAYRKLEEGGIVVAAGTRGLVTGWRAPANTVVVFTDSFMQLNPLQSAYYQQARLRPSPYGF